MNAFKKNILNTALIFVIGILMTGYTKCNNVPDSIYYYLDNAELLLNSSNTEEALQSITSADRLNKTNKEPGIEARINYLLGTLYSKTLKFDESYKYLENSLLYYKKYNLNKKYANSLIILGNNAENQGKYNKALQLYLEAFEIFKNEQDSEGIFAVCNNLGTIYYQTGEIQKALSFYKLSLEHADSATHKTSYKEVLANIGAVYYETWNNDSAYYYFNLVKNIEIEFKDSINLAKTLNSMGAIELAKNDVKEAIRILDEALVISKKLHDPENISSIYNNLGAAYMHKKDLDRAIVYFDNSIQVASRNNLINMLHEAYFNISHAYEKQNNYKQALHYYKLYEELSYSITIEKGLISKTETLLLKQQQENKILRLEKERERSKTRTVLLVSICAMILISGFSFIYISKLRQKNELEKQLANVQKYQFQAVLEAQENERRRIAGDLHDSVGQMLSLTKLNMTDLLDELGDIDDDKHSIIERTIDVLDEACNEVRVISHNLMPGSLIRLGFIAATKDLIRKLNHNNKYAVKLETCELEKRLPEKTEIALYRILQEILSNTIKHSNASEIEIVLSKSENILNLNVSDNGIGFNTDEIKSSDGIGWKNINSRLSTIDAKLTIDSVIGKGVSISIDIPLAN